MTKREKGDGFIFRFRQLQGEEKGLSLSLFVVQAIGSDLDR